MLIYVIGSLRNPSIPEIAAGIRESGHEAFDDWFAAGPEADDCWQRYEQARERDYDLALKAPAAQNVFLFDKYWLDAADAAVLVQPAGKSAHLELGYMLGKGKLGYVLFDNGPPERWDVMYNFADAVFLDRTRFLNHLRDLMP